MATQVRMWIVEGDSAVPKFYSKVKVLGGQNIHFSSALFKGKISSGVAVPILRPRRTVQN